MKRAEKSNEATARSFLRVNRELLKIGEPDDEFLLSSSQSDELGRHHLRFDQRYRGLPVWPAQTIVHLDPNGNVDLLSGAYVPTPSDSGNATTPAIDEDTAVALARLVAPDGDTGTLTKADLIFYATDEGAAKLGWKIELFMALHSNWLVVIDAISGETLASYNQAKNAGVTGKGVDLFNVSRSLRVYQDGSKYYMINTGKPMFGTISSPPYISNIRGAIIVTDAINSPSGDPPKGLPTQYHVTSPAADSGWRPDAVSLAYNLSETYDYYKERHGRDSIDGKGVNIVGTVRYGNAFNNAFWEPSSQQMYFGNGEPYVKALDIVAHEVTHGITEKTANLEYLNQSGALNEAFSDIFGEAVEARSKGAADWLVGAELGSPMRSLKDPHAVDPFSCDGSSRYYPAKMSEFIPKTCKFSNGENDYGWVHFNSSIINHAFYQLAAGLTGAIGMRDAERIFYRALTVHLNAKSQFADARLMAITSAEEIFGKGSAQAIKTAQAFDAVEIYDTAPTSAPAPIPVVSGDDATIFLFKDTAGYRVGRRETALGDKAGGTYLTTKKTVAPTRVNVSGDGSSAAFISSDNDFCAIASDGNSLACAGYSNMFKSVALSPSNRTAAIVLRDSSTGNPSNQINLLDIPTGATQTIELKVPATDAGSISAVYFADAMTFDFNTSRLYYDAATEIPLEDGSKSYVWSIYTLEIASGATLSVIPPIPGLNVANPSLGHVRNDLLVFDAYDKPSNISEIWIPNLTTNKYKLAGTTIGYGFPSFTGDDSAIIYTRVDQAVPSLKSLWKQPLAADHMTASGKATAWLTDGLIPTIYRRGNYTSGTNSGTTAVEFYHAGIDHYFMTAYADEATSLDNKPEWGWTRTGKTYNVWLTQTAAPSNASPVCRFFGVFANGTMGSHFYTVDATECAYIKGRLDWGWGYEGDAFYAIKPTGGTCPSGTSPVYRAYNNGMGGAPNHRYMTTQAEVAAMVAQGWVSEGTAFCGVE